GNNADVDTQSGGGARRNIRRLMLDLNRQPKGNSEGSVPNSNQSIEDMVTCLDASVVGDSTTHPYLLNHDSDNDDAESKLVVIFYNDNHDSDNDYHTSLSA
ncbi:hypothetical protein PIB30_084561, partial [Stylosanthes scabra]|nr:hypothetical protein [Stylosanthes scabra]